MNCPHAGQRVREQSQKPECVTRRLPSMLLACCSGGPGSSLGKPREETARKLSLGPPHLGHSTHFRVAGFHMFPSGHTAPISPPRGPRLGQGLAPTRPPLQPQHTKGEDHHPLPQATGHHLPPVGTCTFTPPLLTLIRDEPLARERGASAWPDGSVTGVTDREHGWERYCTRTQRRAALPRRRTSAQRSFGAKGDQRPPRAQRRWGVWGASILLTSWS